MIAELDDEIVFTEEPRRYRYRGREYRSATAQINAVGFGPDFSHVDPSVLEYACQRGRMVDLALVLHYDDDLLEASVDPAIREYFNAALKFDRDCPGAIVAVHPRLCVPDLNVAGTADLVRFIRGRRCLVDWKTGADNPLQTVMYMMMWNRMYPTSPCYERYGLRLKPSGDYKLKLHDDPDDEAAARAILEGDVAEIERWRCKYGRAKLSGEA